MKHPSKPAAGAQSGDRILSISPIIDDHFALGRIFDGGVSAELASGWPLSPTLSLSSGAAALRKSEFAVVLCERDLAPGSWKDLLPILAGLANPPLLIVTSRHADNYLWAEALNLGAYDVVAKPFDRDEVVLAVSLACLRWRREHSRAGRPACLQLAAGGAPIPIASRSEP